MAGGYSAQPQGIDALVAQLRALRQAQEQLTRRVAALGLQIDVDGSVTIGEDQSLIVTGDTSIQGALSVPAGSIGNSALANPSAMGLQFAVATNFAVPTAAAAAVSVQVPIPDGYSTASIDVLATVSAYNGSGADDYLSCGVKLDAAGGGSREEIVTCLNGHQEQVVAALAGGLSLAGLSGALSFLCTVHSTSGAWAAQASNSATVKASVTFLR